MTTPPSAAEPQTGKSSDRTRDREQRLAELWSDAASWHGSVFLPYYHCRDDGRILVPRKKRWAGWTINFAHRLAWPTMAVSAIVAAGPALIVARLAAGTGYELVVTLAALALSFRVLVEGAKYLSTHEL